MIAYNDRSLDALTINAEARTAVRSNLITKEEHAAIRGAHAEALYTPNLFIRMGLFLLTFIIVLLSFGLYFLVFGFLLAANTGTAIFTGFFTLLIYAALEWIVLKNKHFGSGVDDALLWVSMGFVIATVNFLVPHLSYQDQAALLFILATYAALRFADRLMAALAFISFLVVLFYTVVRFGDTAKLIMPFLLMIVSVAIYLLDRKYKSKKTVRHYASCLIVIEIIALVCAYAAVNYFTVRELSNQMFGLHLREGSTITGGWLFWIATILIPFIYLFRGIQRRDRILLRTSLVLIAAMTFTIRYYYSVAPVEVAMTAGGIVMVMLSYIVTRYLSAPKHGITAEDMHDAQPSMMPQLEALVAAETFHQAPEAGKHFEFGGGSGGGGGATGQY